MKVTYNTYSCTISGISIEMMKMDDQDSTEYQNWEKKDKNVINENELSDTKDKTLNSVCLPQFKKAKT